MARGSQSDPVVSGIKDGVETLTIRQKSQHCPPIASGHDIQECESVDEVKTQTADGPNVIDDEQDLAWLTTNERIERPWPDLGVWRQLECSLCRSPNRY